MHAFRNWKASTSVNRCYFSLRDYRFRQGIIPFNLTRFFLLICSSFFWFTAQIPSNLQLPDLLAHSNVHQQLPRRRVRSSQTPPTSPSCSFQHLSRTFSEVFDPDPTNSMAYFGDDEVFCPNTPAITPSTANNRPTFPPRQRRRRRRTSSLREIRKKNTKSKGDDTPNWNREETTCLNRDDSCENTANVSNVPIIFNVIPNSHEFVRIKSIISNEAKPLL